jgi:hypothetical protein
MNIENFILAHSLNKKYKQLLVDANVHFRASVNSMSLISISSEKPELGVQCNLTKYKLANGINDLIIQDINKIKAKPTPQRPTPEKELQSWIIKYSLNNAGSLPFDSDIKFITSELAIYNNSNERIVTDILGYSISKNQLCVIELKSDRLLTRLIEQVNNFENIISENFGFFQELLSIYQVNNSKPLSQEVIKIIVWRDEKTSPISKLIDAGIVEFTYLKEQDNYIFKSFNYGK